MLQSKEILSNVSIIDVSRLYDIQLTYKDKFTVLLGDGQELDRKIRLLIKIEKMLNKNDTGFIDLKSDEKARFIPYS